jgi:1-acyl-sn-glycerol-3-phosphate acyltransferase
MGAYLRKNQIAVDRGGHATALKSMMRGAREAVAKGRQVIIFPEGTRQTLEAAPDYKPGIAAMYKDLNIAVTPVAVSTGLIWKPKGLMRSPGTATIKFLPPIPPGLPREEFMRRLEDTIESEGQALLPPDKRRTVAA